MDRRYFLVTLAAAVAGSGVQAQGSTTLKVMKSPTCGCCTAWVERMQKAGFTVDIADVDQDTLWAMKDSLGIAPDLAGCHTASVNDYFIEGHVPAEDIQRLVAEAPDARGLAVPGMPMGSPGMDVGGATGAYEVLLVLEDGFTTVFANRT